VLSGHVAADAHGGAAADAAAPAVVDVQAVDARLAVERPYHLRHAGREVGSRQLFHHRPFPPALDAVHFEQAALIVPLYVARAAGRARVDAVHG